MDVAEGRQENCFGDVTPVAPKKLTMRMQPSSAIEAAVTYPPWAQGSDKTILEPLMDLSSHISATKEYADKCRETEIFTLQPGQSVQKQSTYSLTGSNHQRQSLPWRTAWRNKMMNNKSEGFGVIARPVSTYWLSKSSSEARGQTAPLSRFCANDATLSPEQNDEATIS